MRNTSSITLAPDAFINAHGKCWRFDPSYKAHIHLQDGREIPFESAHSIERTPLKTGLGTGESTR